MQATAASLPSAGSRNLWSRLYRPASLLMAVVFGAVGLWFLLLPDGVVAFFDTLSPLVGFQPAGQAAGFYLVLAVAYMYLVTLLAGWMYVRPENDTLPLLLINAKAASAILSFGLFAVRQAALIYLANGVVDGLIAVGVLAMWWGARRRP
jgi:hypothetical protein